MTKWMSALVTAAWLWAGPVQAADRTMLDDKQFQEKIRSVRDERSDAEKLRLARTMISFNLLSSLQVKAIASQFRDENARLDFASAAYPRTIDPENFYEVYDAFTTFSKVMRLHDRIQQMRPSSSVPAPAGPQAVTAAEMKEVLGAVRQEPFEDAKSQIARQILSSSQGNFLAAQIKDLLGCFSFEPTKLELAKFAYDYTLDKEKYFLVNEVFAFSSNRESLSRYIESRKQAFPLLRP